MRICKYSLLWQQHWGIAGWPRRDLANLLHQGDHAGGFQYGCFRLNAAAEGRKLRQLRLTPRASCCCQPFPDHLEISQAKC